MDLREKIVRELKSPQNLLNGTKSELALRGDAPQFPIDFLPNLNKKTWGLRIGLNIIAGRTSQGKSCLAKQIAYNMAKNGITTLFMSLEDSSEAIIESLFCNTQEIDNYDLLTGFFSIRPDYQESWEKFQSEFPNNLFITNNIGSTFEEVNYMIEASRPEPKCVVVDYIQAIKDRGRNERENINEYIRNFREICVRKGIAGIMVSQMNRMAVWKESRNQL